MKDLYSKIDEILVGDAELRGLVGYKQEKKVPTGKEGYQAGISEHTIRRGFQSEVKSERLVSYYFQVEFFPPEQDFSPNIREVPLVVNIYDRTNDLSLYDIADRVIFLLHEADLTVRGKAHCYGCYYNGQIQSPNYNKDLKSYMMSLRFLVYARKEI